MTSRLDEGEARARLDDLRIATASRRAGLEGTFGDIVAATTDVATDDEHDPEGHTIAWERQQVAALLDETGEVLVSIDEAERRVDAGTYGECTDCGGPISDERLAALPATPVCVDCAT